MRKHFFFLVYIISIFSLSCNENVHHKEIEIKFLNGVIDTLNGLEFAYRVNMSNYTNRDVNFYTGQEDDEISANGGFYLTFKKMNKSYQMTPLIKNGMVLLPAHSLNKGFILNVCFREYCKNIADYDLISTTYCNSKSKAENINNLIKDLSIEYRINKEWKSESYQSIFKRDSVLYFNQLDTFDTKLLFNLTGDTFKKMLSN